MGADEGRIHDIFCTVSGTASCCLCGLNCWPSFLREKTWKKSRGGGALIGERCVSII